MLIFDYLFKKNIMATQKLPVKAASSKKEYKKAVAMKLKTVLQELKASLGNKEFEHRVKKAAKVLTHGVSGNAPAPAASVRVTRKATSPKKIKKVKKASPAKAKAKKTAPVG